MDQNRFLEFDVTRRIYAIKCFSYVHYRTSKPEDGISGVKIALDNETCIRVLGKNFRTKGKKEDETRKQNILGKTSLVITMSLRAGIKRMWWWLRKFTKNIKQEKGDIRKST